jgi:uncharacterized protein (UPF0335 family)
MTGALVERDEAQEPSNVKCTIRIGDSPEIPFDDAGKEKLKEHFKEVLKDAASRRVTQGIAAEQLRSIVERIERMQEEAAGIAADVKDIYAEAKGNGYDVKTLRRVIALRKLDAAERDEADHLLDTYARALGMKPQLEMFDE